MLRLLPMSDRDKDVDILALRHQIAVLFQANSLLACDFFETATFSGARMYVVAVIEHTTRRVQTCQPNSSTAH